jgi:hypothetical protein
MQDRDAQLQSIRVRYQSAYCRSKLEAKWLVWLDSLQVPWVYEIEGYALKLGDRTRGYLPDVWLPREKRFVEIKPSEVEIEGELYQTFADLIGRDLLLVQGSPWVDEHTISVYQPGQPAPLTGFVWATGRTDGTLWLLRTRPEPLAYPLARHVDGDHWPLPRSEALLSAYRRASQYEFWTPK